MPDGGAAIGWIARKLRDPYNVMPLCLLILVLADFQQNGGLPSLGSVAIITASSVAADSILAYVRLKRKLVSVTALISGLIVSLVMSPQSPLPFLVLVPALAQLSKHLIRADNSPVFNPATLSMFLVFVATGYRGEAWWGNTNVALALLLGLFVSYSIRRLYASFAFVASLAALALLASLISAQPAAGALALALSQAFFAFFMVVEPRTSPQAGYPWQLAYGFTVALVLFAGNALGGALFPFPVFEALLAGNLVTLLSRLSKKS